VPLLCLAVIRSNGIGAVYALLIIMRALKVILSFSILLLAVAIIVPNFVKPRAVSAMSACVANLRQIQEAKQAWALETHAKPTDIPVDSDLFGEGRPLRVKPGCPAGGSYTLGALNENVTCTIGPPVHTLDYKKYQ